MSKFLCCCSRSSGSTLEPPEERRWLVRGEINNIYDVRRVHVQRFYTPKECFNPPERYRGFEHSERSSRHSSDEKAACTPKLECFVIPSFGKDPPTNVAVKKASNDFLGGVVNDLTTIQRLIGKDDQKELGNIELLCHFKQEKLANFTRIIEDRMKDLKLNGADIGKKGCK